MPKGVGIHLLLRATAAAPVRQPVRLILWVAAVAVRAVEVDDPRVASALLDPLAGNPVEAGVAVDDLLASAAAVGEAE